MEKKNLHYVWEKFKRTKKFKKLFQLYVPDIILRIFYGNFSGIHFKMAVFGRIFSVCHELCFIKQQIQILRENNSFFVIIILITSLRMRTHRCPGDSIQILKTKVLPSSPIKIRGKSVIKWFLSYDRAYIQTNKQRGTQLCLKTTFFTEVDLLNFKL